MTALELIMKLLGEAAGAGGGLVALLNRLKQAVPDTAAEVDRVLGALGEAVLPENLAAVGTAVLSELKDIGTGKIVPRDHPSDGA